MYFVGNIKARPPEVVFDCTGCLFHIRYINFASRGYVPHSAKLREWIIDRIIHLADSSEDFRRTWLVFLGRKIFRGDLDKCLANERAFRTTFVREYCLAKKADESARRARELYARWFMAEYRNAPQPSEIADFDQILEDSLAQENI